MWKALRDGVVSGKRIQQHNITLWSPFYKNKIYRYYVKVI